MTGVPFDAGRPASTAAQGRPAPMDGVPPRSLTGTSRDFGSWGLWGLVATEAALFAYLISSYFYLKQANVGWPTAGAPELGIALPNTFILIASSGGAWWAERSVGRGSRDGLIVGLAVTLVLGATFLVLQGVEYSHADFTLRSHAYGSAFFTITGFHGAHVLVGLLAVGHTLLRALAGHFDRERHLAVTNTVLYWHFVDVVWLVVFTSLYLSPRWT